MRKGVDGGCCGNTNDTHPHSRCEMFLSSRYNVIACTEVGSANPCGLEKRSLHICRSEELK